ncbi:MAG: accessory gene regulator B family protein [Eubacteriales bacterium]
MSKKISSFFISNNIIKEEDKEVYEYSLEILLSTLLNFAAVIILAIFTGKILEATLFVLGFIPLRALAGGYHASNHFRCFLILLFTYSMFLLTVFFIPVKVILAATIFLILSSILLIFILSPVEDSNKPLSKEETRKFKRKSRISILVYSLTVLGLSLLLSNKIFGYSLAFGIFSVSLSLLASVIRNKIANNVNNA